MEIVRRLTEPFSGEWSTMIRGAIFLILAARRRCGVGPADPV